MNAEVSAPQESDEIARNRRCAPYGRSGRRRYAIELESIVRRCWQCAGHKPSCMVREDGRHGMRSLSAACFRKERIMSTKEETSRAYLLRKAAELYAETGSIEHVFDFTAREFIKRVAGMAEANQRVSERTAFTADMRAQFKDKAAALTNMVEELEAFAGVKVRPDKDAG
jgi:hypothetical protein